jgi:hypothetical protein
MISEGCFQKFFDRKSEPCPVPVPRSEAKGIQPAIYKNALKTLAIQKIV